MLRFMRLSITAPIYTTHHVAFDVAFDIQAVFTSSVLGVTAFKSLKIVPS